jgi:preprotein translocase subunit SecA
MRVFGSERISKVMDRLGFEEGEVIEHSMISKSIERAQKKVEENNFGIRKRLLEYDDVMNAQREVVYSKRRHALMGERIGVDIANMIFDTVSYIAENYDKGDDYEGLQDDLRSAFSIEIPFSEEEFAALKLNPMVDKIYTAVLDNFKRRMDNMAAAAFPVIKQVFEEKGQQYQNIIIPVTDGKRTYNIMVNLEDAYKTEGKEVIKSFEKTILLYVIDEAWKEHLRELDELRNSVQNASYEQKDPLLIYKLESFNLFRTMIDSINRKALAVLMRGQIPTREPDQVRQAGAQQRLDFSRYRTRTD